jgi:hypothetical protein
MIHKKSLALEIEDYIPFAVENAKLISLLPEG